MVSDPAVEINIGESSICFRTIAFLVAFTDGVVLLFSSFILELAYAVVKDTGFRFPTLALVGSFGVVPFINCANNPVILELLDIIGIA